MKCKRTGGRCTASKCETWPCRANEPGFNGRACPRCGADKFEESKGLESHWIACTRCNWSVTTFATPKRKGRLTPDTSSVVRNRARR